MAAAVAVSAPPAESELDRSGAEEEPRGDGGEEDGAQNSSPTGPHSRLAKLPLSRIKALMKADPDVSLASQESVFIIAKATVLNTSDVWFLSPPLGTVLTRVQGTQIWDPIRKLTESRSFTEVVIGTRSPGECFMVNTSKNYITEMNQLNADHCDFVYVLTNELNEKSVKFNFQELFVEMIAKDALVYAQQGKRKTLQRKDLDNAIEAIDEFAFLEGTLD